MKERNRLEAFKPIRSQMRTTTSAPRWSHKEGTELLVTKTSAKARHQGEIIPTHKSKHSSLQSPIYVFQCQNSKYFSAMVCRTGRSPARPMLLQRQPSPRPESKQDMAAQTQTHSLLPSPHCTGNPCPPALHLPPEAAELH